MRHQTISFIKSGLRILGYVMLIPYSFTLMTIPALVLTVSEIIGIIEEVGHE